ncbi:MAG: 30S ribosomal protein S6 [Verrucomicrobia bacterium]|nr:30S ribosomal protein S6 [Verrucomicrobiota bacterium]
MTKKKEQLYEGMYILNAGLSEEAKGKALEKLKEQIVSHGGKVEKVHDWGRRRLAYEIGGKREGYYYILYFVAPTEAKKELFREYSLNEDLLRYMTLQVEEVVDEIKFKPLIEQQQQL